MPGPRQPDNLVRLSRSPVIGRLAIVNHFKRAVDDLTPTTKYPSAKALLTSSIWPWIRSYLKKSFSRKHPFPKYALGKKNGVYQIGPLSSNTVRIAIAGDWGTGTADAEKIATLMVQTSPDLTIHLGDVYYVGEKDEIKEKCLGQDTKEFRGVNWPHGTQGSFALNGNHEMYSNGDAYFRDFLSTLGMKGDPKGQEVSFFCLEIGEWRILGIDTGYNSLGIPILGVIPGLKQIPFLGGNCRLRPELIEWLRETVKPQIDPKPTLLLSHHQYFTAFPKEQNYPKPAQQLTEFFKGQELVWIWGHEHRLGIYERWQTAEGIGFYGRCVGHGGMPIELVEPIPKKAPLAFYDGDIRRSYDLDPKIKLGLNGFVNVAIENSTLTLEYRDIKDTVLFVEEFTPAGGGSLTYRVVNNPNILRRP